MPKIEDLGSTYPEIRDLDPDPDRIDLLFQSLPIDTTDQEIQDLMDRGLRETVRAFFAKHSSIDSPEAPEGSRGVTHNEYSKIVNDTAERLPRASWCVVRDIDEGGTLALWVLTE
ncbi:MAG: hypothetical protein ACI9QC_000886 [Oceanicoccus sp.]|jgi:hypothetical protein